MYNFFFFFLSSVLLEVYCCDESLDLSSVCEVVISVGQCCPLLTQQLSVRSCLLLKVTLALAFVIF